MVVVRFLLLPLLFLYDLSKKGGQVPFSLRFFQLQKKNEKM
ncbi:MAG: hypothetical protein RBG13Loki_0957 [Promethearchaeota archaeon CR_4]|nr:MAG: hypothetical protein RBG13Loki_0957 [Candidatus Lokiarchaeota archaeon CR_4]